jgi:hypothetical protein
MKNLSLVGLVLFRVVVGSVGSCLIVSQQANQTVNGEEATVRGFHAMPLGAGIGLLVGLLLVWLLFRQRSCGGARAECLPTKRSVLSVSSTVCDGGSARAAVQIACGLARCSVTTRRT